MGGTLFVLFLGIYLLVATKVNEWTIISTLGFKLQAPLGFLQRPHLYFLGRTALFWVAATTAVLGESPPLYKAVPALLLAWAVSIWLGRRRGFEAYRQTYRELLAYEDQVQNSNPAEYREMLQGEDPATHRADLEAGATTTNRDLKERLRIAAKYGA